MRVRMYTWNIFMDLARVPAGPAPIAGSPCSQSADSTTLGELFIGSDSVAAPAHARGVRRRYPFVLSSRGSVIHA
jgi:hypothetical protein